MDGMGCWSGGSRRYRVNRLAATQSLTRVSPPVWRSVGAANTNAVLRARDARKLAQGKHAVEDMLERVRRAQSNSALSFALSRRKQGGFESPRERQ
jgi:hypothetical protein